MDHDSFETRVKLAIYGAFAGAGRAPTSRDVAAALGATADAVEAAFDALHARRLLVTEPGDRSRIRMAPPFSGIATPFRVAVGDRTYDANCAWDALGIPAALHADAVIHASDGHSGEPITLVVRDGAPVPEPCVIHFAVPAAHWWDDIIHT